MAALSEEQAFIREQASAWVDDKAPVGTFRILRDTGAGAGYAPTTWEAMVEMGWSGILVPEAHGGSNLGFLTFGLILEQTGRQLTASPLFASALVGASALTLAGSSTQCEALLPKVVDGSAILTLAIDESTHHQPTKTALAAVVSEGGFTLSGSKSFVQEGMSATHFVVAARTSGVPAQERGISLFLVPAASEGLTRSPVQTFDSRDYARLEFNEVALGSDALLGELDAGMDVLTPLLDRAGAGLAAEMLGTASQAFEMTLEYLKTREQFGQVIGSFQALGHRAAALFSAKEQARSCVEAALQAIDAQADNASELASLAQCKAGQFLYDMSNELIQIHGGIGMTDEFDAGLYLKRARTLETLYGNRAYHRDRYARLRGF